MSNVSARKIYELLVSTLNEKKLNFAQDDDEMTVNATVTTEDLPIQFVMRVMEDRDVLQFHSVLPIKFPEDKRVEGAVVTQIANYGMINGSFDYDIRDGEVAFRMSTSFTETMLSSELIWKMLGVSCSTIDAYNDRFFMVAKNMMTVEQFIKADE